MNLRRLATTGLFTLLFSLAGLTAFPAQVQALVPSVDQFTVQDEFPGNQDITPDQCGQLESTLAGALGCDTGDSVSDFTQFTGQLEGPDAAGYDEALTRTRTAREFIQTIANFALSFLGLVATLMIIYGGVLYVTSRGDEEAATNGKKTISYAAIGIVIILGSFAFVNTLLGATGGSQGQVAGTVNSGTTITEAGGSFDVNSVLRQIGSITAEYQTTFNNYLFIGQRIAYMQSLQVPRAVSVVETDISLEGLGEALAQGPSGQDQTPFVDTYTLVDQREVQQYIANLRRALQEIQGKADPLSDTYEAAQAMLNYLRTGQSSTVGFSESLLPTAYAADDCDPFVDAECSQTFHDFSIFFPGGTIYETEASLIDDQIGGFLEEMQVRAFGDYTESVGALAESFQDLEALFDTSGDGSGSSLTEVLNAFQEASQALENVADPSLFGANSSRELLNKMNALAGLVQNLEFVNVRMTASTLKGNAPVIVRFNALGTEDPSGLTVTDEQIEWDLNGDGLFNTALDGNPSGATVSFTYDAPGTYRARVRVRSQSENIAAGIASLTIQVAAPRAIIILDAIAGGETSRLADYGAFPPISKNAYKVTMAEAQEGVTFDASKTTDGNGNAAGIVAASWDFGDNETLTGSWGEQGVRTPVHRYGRPGTYDVLFTVTDETGVEDRKVFTLFVASPAARLNVTPAKGVVGTVFGLDATGSSTDIGTIVDYKWSATVNGEPYTLPVTSGNRVKTVFDRPGIYVVTLTVVDSSGKEDETSTSIVVESQPPIATFDFSVPKSNQPGIVVFDASESYDPDLADTLTFDWLIEGTRGKDYQILETSERGDEITVKFGEAKEYKISLTVSDQHPEALKKRTTISKNLQVTSVLDADLILQGNPARYLDENGSAAVEFLAKSDNATAFQIDYGDGNKDFTDLISNGQSVFTHEYESAGVFFATLTALDDDNNKTIVDERVYIAVGDSPIAVMEVASEGEDIGLGPVLKGNIRTRFTFDAARSVNVDGTGNNLSYSWNFGNGITSNQKTVTHVFDEHAVYTVTLTVKDKKDPSLTSSTTMQIDIKGIPPKIRSITVVPDASTLETPLKVNVSVDAVDEDGRITFVKAWYYDLEETAEELGTVIAQGTEFSMTINTKGEEGELKDYGFAVEVTDNSNQVTSSLETLAAGAAPTLQVKNGPNDTPVAAFAVDRTSIMVGDEVVFSSTAFDPDGKIVNYWWDLEGDGFFNNEAQKEASLAHTFTQIHLDGVQVRLKVEDDAGATATSEPLTIYVDSLADAPEARFISDVSGRNVTLKSQSIADEENGARIQSVYWDFDLTKDSNGNGQPDDDLDATTPEARASYSKLGVYRVKLTVVDSTGQTDSVEQEVPVVDAQSPVANFTMTAKEKEVSFRDRSTSDVDQGVTLRSYEWDFDGDSSVDSTDRNPKHTYPEAGVYEVSLTVTDSLGQKNSIVQTLNVGGALSALLTSVPTPNRLGQIELNGEQAEVNFFYNAEGGTAPLRYVLDKNIFQDTDGDRIRDNDVDYSASTSGAWRTTFYKTDGQTVAKLTVTDASGKSAVATLQIVFSGFLGSANLFNITPTGMWALILFAMFTAGLGVVMTFRYDRPRK